MTDSRWRTTFGRWVRTYGVARLRNDMARRGMPVTRNAIYFWVDGSAQPTPDKAALLVRLSRGQLSLDTIYAHCRKRQARAAGENLSEKRIHFSDTDRTATAPVFPVAEGPRV